MPSDPQILLPVTVRLPSAVVSEARARGEYVRGGASAVLRRWIVAGKSQDANFSPVVYDGLITNKKEK